jgi:hypothetical protein
MTGRSSGVIVLSTHPAVIIKNPKVSICIRMAETVRIGHFRHRSVTKSGIRGSLRAGASSHKNQKIKQNPTNFPSHDRSLIAAEVFLAPFIPKYRLANRNIAVRS